MPKYGSIDPGLTTLNTQELYEQNKQDTQQREEKFINPQQDFANTIQAKSKYGTPIEEPIGNMFIPFGGVKPVDENAVQNIEDLQDIPEARAQSQTTGKLIANSLGQTLNELTVGLGYGVAQLFDDDIAKTNAGDQNFENAASTYFKEIQDKINEDVFPIYQTHRSEEGNFIDKLGDGTWWASNFPQIASTAQMLIPALGTSSAIRMLGEIGKESRIAKMMAKGLTMDAALAKDAEFINTIGSIGAAGTSRHIENNMEASQTFQQVYQESLQKGIPEEQAKKLAGEAAARNWKYNLALLSSDILEYATLLKPFKSFGKIAEGLQASKVAKIAKPLTIAIPESIEEATQFITSAEASQNKPFDKDFFNKRLGDYLADPQLQTAAYWGAVGGSGMYAAGSLMRKISQASSNLATNKVTAATFGDAEKAKNLDQDTFNSLLSRNYSIDKLDRMQNDMKAFRDEYISKPDITPEEKQEIEDKYKDWTDQVNFVKETDKNALSDPKFQKNPETRKSFVLQQLEAKNLAEDISANKSIVDSYYSELPSAYNDIKNVNKEINKLNALKVLQKSVKAANFHDIKKDYHLNDIEKQIIVQEAKVNSAKEAYKISTGKEYTKQILPQEFLAINAHSRLERDQFKHDNIIQPELLKYQNDSEEKIAEKEQEIKNKQKETVRKTVENITEEAKTPEDLEAITSVLQSEEFEANNSPEVAEAIFGKINKKAKEETVNTAHTPKFPLKDRSTRLLKKKYSIKSYDELVEDYVTAKKRVKDLQFNIQYYYQIKDNKLTSDEKESLGQIFKDAIKELNIIEEAILNSNFSISDNSVIELSQYTESTIIKTKQEAHDKYEKELEFLLKEEAIEIHPTDDRIFIIRDIEYYNYAANAIDAINRDKDGNIVSITLLDKKFNQKTFTKEKIVDFISYYILAKELTTYEEQLEEKIDIAKSKEVITDIVNEEVNIESKSEIYKLHRLLDEAVEINSELNKLFHNTFAQYIELGFKKAEILQDPEIFEINQQKDIIERSIVDIKRKINKLKPNSFDIKKDKPVNKKIKVYESNIKENGTEIKLGNQVGIKEQIAQGESSNIRQQIEELQVPAEPVVPFAEERYAEAPATFVIDKAEFIKRIKELPIQDKNTEEFINLLSRVKTPKQLDNAITTNTISEDIQDVIAEVYEEANTSQNKKKAKEEKEFDKQIDKLQSNPVDSEVEGTIEHSVNFTTDIPTEKSNVFHINASQYKVNNIDGKRQVVGDKLPFANQFNWEAINNLPIGSELTARIDPDHIIYIGGKPLKNSEVAPNQQLVSLSSENGVEVGILYTQNEANKALFPIWRNEVQNKGEKKFKVVQKYKGDINTYTEIKDGDITIPAARNSLTDIERAYGKKLILGYVHGTTAGSIVRTPNRDIPEIRLGAKNKSGQIVIALPKGNGEYMAYSLVTKSLRQGEGVDYKNVPLAENSAFKEVLDSLKGLQVGNIEGNEILIDKLHSFISLPTLISTNKKTGTPYIQFNPVHIKKKHLDAFKDVKGINSYLREGKKEGDTGAYVILVSKDIIDNLQLTKYDKGTPEAAIMDFLGEMKLQIDGSKLNQDDYYETVSKRTKTNLANDPVVNVSFFIQPITDEVQLTPKEVDTTVQKSKTKDISDVKREEELPAKELGNIKDNVAEVSNLDQTDGNPININNRSKNGVDFLFESNPELANAVYEALGFNQNKKIIASIKKNNKIITQYSDDTFDVVVDNFAYEEAKAKYYKDYIERKKYIKKVEKNPSIIEDYWDEKSESRVIFPLLHMSKYEFNKKLNSIVTFSIDGDAEYGFGAKKFNPKEFDLVATRNDERVGYKKTPLKEFIGFLEEANEQEYKDKLGILELWKSPEGIKRMKDEIQFYYDRSEFEKSSAERLPKEFKASNKGYTLREAGGSALNIIKGSGGAIRGYLLYKGRTSNGQPDAYNLIDSITDTDVYIRYTQVNEEFRGEKLSSILLDRVRKDYPNHYVHRTLIVNPIVVVQSSKIVGAADAFGNSIENINTISKATEWLKTNNEIILPPLSKGKINKQQKQEAQQKFQEYVNATGRQDIEGFKNFVSTNKQPAKIETLTKRGRTTLVRKPVNTTTSNIEELKKDIEKRRREELSNIPVGSGLTQSVATRIRSEKAREINRRYDLEFTALSKLSSGVGAYKVWNKEKELNWLSKQLPNIPIEVLDGIAELQKGLDVDVYGRFENSIDELKNPVGTIYLAENTKEGTAYHEAFHTVFWVGLNSRQRRSVLKDARSQYGEFSDDTLEEMMADNFIPYVETEGTIEVKGNVIKNFFEKIYNWIKYNVFGQVEIKNLYYKINSGQYANLKPVKVNVSKLSSSLRPAIFEDRVNTLVANFSLAIDDYVDEHKESINLTRTQLLKSIDNGTDFNNIEYFLAQAYNNLKKDYESDPDSTWGKQMALFLSETVKGISPEGKILWGPIGKKALQKIGSREGFKVNANQILEVQNANPDEEYEISEEEIKLDGWQVDVKSQSGHMGLSNEVRKELSYIPLTGDKAIDDLGYQRYVNFDEVYATLKRELADLYTAERIEKKLQEITSTTRPELMEIYNKFISEEPGNKLFRTKFVNDFAKTHVDFKMAVQKNDGRVAIYSSNSTTIINMIIDNWQSEFYNSGYFTPDGNVNVDKITPVINEILKAPTVVEKMKLFNDKFNLNLDSRVFDNISQDMLYIIGDLSKGNNIFETNTSKLKELAKLDAKYKTDLLESSFRNIEGKTVYSHILPSFTSKQIANMKYDFDTWYNYYSTDPFYKNSPLLNSILKDRSILDNLEYSMIDGSKYKGESEGTSYADFSDKQFLSMQINMFYNNGAKGYGWYQTPILSDSPEGVYIKLPKYKTSDALDKLVEVAKQEYERIKESNDNKLGVKNFDENANKFLFMTFLRRPDLEKSDAEIKQIIKEGLSKKFNDYWEFLQKNNIFDLSDNLGVTRELIPNYFKLKEEKRTTLIEEELNEVRASMWNYFLNQVYAGSQIITLTTGDPAFYKSVTDYYKRAKEIVSPTMQMDNSAVYVLSKDEIENEGTSEQIITPGENYNTLYVNDVNIVGQIGKELFDTFTKTGDVFYAQTAAKYGYSNDKDGKFLEIEIEGKKYKFKSDLVNVADAQTFISPNRYRKVAVGYGRWNKQIQQTFGRMVSNKTLLPEDYNVAMQPYKPFVFGHIKQGSRVTPVQNKNSEAILFPQLAKSSPTLQKLYDIMQENSLDSISFESVVKVGLSNAVSWEDLLSGIDIKDKIHTLDNSNYGLQQEVPVHYIDDSALFGTQIMKHIIANLDLTANYNGRTGQEIADYFQKLISENVEISYKQAREELGLSGNVVDNKKLSEILQREILSRDLGEDIFEAAGLDANGEFNIHPADPLHSDRNEKLLNSIYKNRVTKQKIKGGSFVQASGIGFMDDLQMVTKKNPDGTIKSIDYVECMLPWSSRKFFEPFMDKDGIIDIKKVQETNPDLLDMIGYRIPTEDKYSMLPLRVVDFLPAQMGGVVMLPMEITTLAGSDFDVDKLYIMMPEFNVRFKKAQAIKRMRESYLNAVKEGKAAEGIDFSYDNITMIMEQENSGIELSTQDKGILKLYNYLDKKGEFNDFKYIEKITDLETTEGRNNMLIDLMRDVLTNEKTFKQFIKPGGFSDLQKNANIIYLVAEKAAKYSDIVNWSDKQINDAVESLIAKQGIDLTSPLSNARMFNRNMTGKKLVGIEANHNANHSILQFTNITLSKPIIIDGKTYQSLHDIYNNAGELISNNVAQRLAAVVDNAKDPNAFKANLNTYTADVDALLTRLGVPMIQSFALLKQPIIVELTRLYYLHGGDFNAEETAIKEVADLLGIKVPDITKINDTDITSDNLISGLQEDLTSEGQKDMFVKFLLYKNRAKSLADLIRSMGSMTNGAGPTLADNEIVIRNQRQILLDGNLLGVAELFSGEKYPLFKAFNDNGLIKPQEDLKKVFPLGNTNEDSWVNKTKLLLQNSIAKNKLSAKDLNKFNNFILSYISDGFELYDPKLQKYFIENFPVKYKKILEANPELKEFRITKFIEFKQDDNFPFGRLEFNNTGALTNTLKDDLKDSWYQMFTDDNPETRKFALNLLRYSKYKEGFLFGPKTYTHIQPTKFFTSVEEGRVINKAWKKVFKAEDLDMNPKDSERVVKQFIRNNWKNTGFVPIVEETSKITFVEGKPSAVSVGVKDSKYKTDTGFVEFVKVPIQIVVGKKTKTDYVLMEKVYQTFNKQGQPITAVYRPTNKLGKSAYLVETNRMMDNFSSILPENNIGKVADVDIRKLASSVVVEETVETFESEYYDTSVDTVYSDYEINKKLKENTGKFLNSLPLKHYTTKHGLYDKHNSDDLDELLKSSILLGDIFKQPTQFYVLKRNPLDAESRYNGITQSRNYLIDTINKQIIPIFNENSLFFNNNFNNTTPSLPLSDVKQYKYSNSLGQSVKNRDLEKAIIGVDTLSPEVTTLSSDPQKGLSFIYNGVSITTEFILGVEQTKALKDLIDFTEQGNLDHKYKNIVTLQGAAGTGKTSIIGYLFKYLKEKNKRVSPIYIAPTHAATAELGFATVKTGNTQLPATVQSSITFDQNKGIFVFTKKIKDRIKFHPIIVVDESSMLDNDDVTNLISASEDANAELIFMGDYKQIPKVSQGINNTKPVSPVFTVFKQITLNEIFRQSESNLLNLLGAVRQQTEFKPFKIDNTSSVKFLDKVAFNENLFKDLKNDPEGTIIITYTNNGVKSYNSFVRNDFFGRTGSPIKEDIIVGYLGYANKQIEKKHIANSISYTIENITIPPQLSSGRSLQVISKKLQDLNDKGIRIPYEATSLYLQLSATDSLSFSELSVEDYRKNNAVVSDIFREVNSLNELYKSKKIKYGEYLETLRGVTDQLATISLGDTYIYNPATDRMEKFNSITHKGIKSNGNGSLLLEKGIDYGHAITIHKSQGTTINNVYFDAESIKAASDIKIMDGDAQLTTEKQALYYVGLSRSKNSLTVLEGNLSMPKIAFESGENVVSLPMDKTKKDLIDNFELYQPYLGDITIGDITNADEQTLTEILKKICNN